MSDFTALTQLFITFVYDSMARGQSRIDHSSSAGLVMSHTSRLGVGIG